MSIIETGLSMGAENIHSPEGLNLLEIGDLAEGQEPNHISGEAPPAKGMITGKNKQRGTYNLMTPTTDGNYTPGEILQDGARKITPDDFPRNIRGRIKEMYDQIHTPDQSNEKS